MGGTIVLPDVGFRSCGQTLSRKYSGFLSLARGSALPSSSAAHSCARPQRAAASAGVTPSPVVASTSKFWRTSDLTPMPPRKRLTKATSSQRHASLNSCIVSSRSLAFSSSSSCLISRSISAFLLSESSSGSCLLLLRRMKLSSLVEILAILPPMPSPLEGLSLTLLASRLMELPGRTPGSSSSRRSLLAWRLTSSAASRWNFTKAPRFSKPSAILGRGSGLSDSETARRFTVTAEGLWNILSVYLLMLTKPARDDFLLAEVGEDVGESSPSSTSSKPSSAPRVLATMLLRCLLTLGFAPARLRACAAASQA
mmetsp:Transcript_84/g.231  ORF Transcript_84/g.231 Transcript_84/m.231 type:complete len:312 (+) Transcript_84:787-1722(+)